VKRQKKRFISRNNFRFIFCSFFPVGLEDYVSYFKKKFNDFIYLKWKFPHSKDEKAYSCLQFFSKGRAVHKKKLFSFSVATNKFLYFLLLPINYLIYFYQAIFILGSGEIRKSSHKKTIFMGVNYFCAFCGIILKKIGKVDFVIYRVMDFFPLPPRGIYRYLNRIFYMLDKYCLENCDSIWFTTEGHIIGREKYGYFDRRKYNYQVIPLGINTKEFISMPISKRDKFSLVYCGVVSRYHMLDLVFEVISELKKSFNEIKLNVIGSGPDLKHFEKLAKRKELENNIIFHGFLEESEKFRGLMANNILGIALYRNEEDFMKYTEPAKVKHYLSFGVPAIVSRVPAIAEELDRKKICFAVNNDKDEIVRVVKKFILDKKMQKEYIKNIKKFVKKMDIYELLDNTFSRTL